MKGERRLRLVPPAQQPGEPRGEETPASEQELRQAGALAEAIERGDDPLARALRFAFGGSAGTSPGTLPGPRSAAAPAALDEADHEALIARALGDEAAPPTRAEQAAAERLREALEGAPRAGGDADLADALRAAYRPAPLPELRNEALIARALPGRGGERHRRIAPVTMAALSTLAAVAAAVALLVGPVADQAAPTASGPASVAAPAALILSRSTAELFDPATPFPREGGETQRIDRIASARASDLRANRYAAWGVR
jgi:hypothetical protein